MDRLEELKNKYQAALQTIQQKGVVLAPSACAGQQAFHSGIGPSEAIKNEVWSQIKAADAQFSDLTCDLQVDSSLPTATSGGRGSGPQRRRGGPDLHGESRRHAFQNRQGILRQRECLQTRFSKRTRTSSAAPIESMSAKS